MIIDEIRLYRIRLPLGTPYRLSYRTVTAFEPLLVQVLGRDGRAGWGEGHISPGSGAETPAGGWGFCRELAARLCGADAAEAKATLWSAMAASPVAATALVTAIEMLEGEPLLAPPATETRLPLLTPVNGLTADHIAAEITERLADGYRTFKVKVGKDVDADLARVGAVQDALAGRGTMRLDANQAYSEADARRFAAALDPAGIELFEQPCAAADWAANAAVAAASPVPLMLDEAICGSADIERAATLAGVGLCKLKLKRLGGVRRLSQALTRVRELGMAPVLGDGLGTEISCWMEASVARTTIDNAGEFNGFLKPRARLFAEPLRCAGGALVLPPMQPRIDPAALARHTVVSERHAVARTRGAGEQGKLSAGGGV